jgi:hypothetical protein
MGKGQDGWRRVDEAGESEKGEEEDFDDDGM